MQTPCQTHDKPPKLGCQRGGEETCLILLLLLLRSLFPVPWWRQRKQLPAFGNGTGPPLSVSISMGLWCPQGALFLRRTGTSLLGEADLGGQLATERVKQVKQRVPGRDRIWLGCELGGGGRAVRGVSGPILLAGDQPARDLASCRKLPLPSVEA